MIIGITSILSYREEKILTLHRLMIPLVCHLCVSRPTRERVKKLTPDTSNHVAQIARLIFYEKTPSRIHFSGNYLP